MPSSVFFLIRIVIVFFSPVWFFLFSSSLLKLSLCQLCGHVLYGSCRPAWGWNELFMQVVVQPGGHRTAAGLLGAWLDPSMAFWPSGHWDGTNLLEHKAKSLGGCPHGQGRFGPVTVPLMETNRLEGGFQTGDWPQHCYCCRMSSQKLLLLLFYSQGQFH